MLTQTCFFSKSKILIFIIGVFCALLLSSCKTKILAVQSNASKTLDSKEIIKNHYSNKKDFSTLYIKANAKYKDEKQSQSVTAEIKIKKDEIILVSIRFLGITMAKALITPNKVEYYEKIGNKYFEGDFSALSQFLGTDLDFDKVQNLFIGQALDDLKKEEYKTAIEDKLYKLQSIIDSNTIKSFYFDSEKFQIQKEVISQIFEKRTLQVIYPSFKDYLQASLPESIQIEANQEKGKTNITIDYNSATFNEELNFPYSVPSGYERIFIN